MQYVFSDFYFLCGAAAKEARTVGDAYRHMAALMGTPVTEACLAFTLQGLCAGGYVRVIPEDGVITASTALTVTDAGKKAARISGLQKIFGEAKAFHKNQARFCAQDRPAASAADSWTVDGGDFARITRDMMEKREIANPLFALSEGDDGLLTVTLHRPGDGYLPAEEDAEESVGYDPDEVEATDSVTVTGAAERILLGLSDLLVAAKTLLKDPRTRKVALHGADRSYIVTLAHTASEYGTSLRMTVEPIRFNRQRFYGKRDGDLDYAQCGSPCLIHEMSGAPALAALLLPCTMALPAYLREEQAACIHDLHHDLLK